MTVSEQDTATGEEARGHFTPALWLAAVASAISSFLYGYDTGIISAALLQIRKDFNTGHSSEQVIAGSILFGAVLGALACSRLSEQRGRRGTILMLACIFIVGALACALSPSAPLLCVSRVILGFAVGGATQTVPMYVAELAPPARRGQLVLTFQVGIGTGILVSTIVGATQSLSWRVSIGLAVVPATILLLTVLRLPESPRWLVAQDRADDARKSLSLMRPRGASLDGEIGEITQNVAEELDVKASQRGWSGLRQAWVRPAVIVGCGIAMFTQLSGIEMIIYYAPTILTDAGFSTSTALRVSVGLASTYLVMMLVGLNIIDRVGRRRLTLIMVPGTAAALFVLGLLFVTGHSGRHDIPFIITCLIVFMFFNAGGLQLMGWLTESEIYPLAVRGAGSSLQAAVLWTTNLAITLTVLTIIDAVGVGQTMWLYALFNVAAWIFVFVRMPELTGRSLEQIEHALREGHFTPRSFAQATRDEAT
ncbi:sugar porter family MFS transporter [Allobranchiibius sp. GilTou73]|uniref:sugar porter family MFS transporter n=1 Tax=Allobranchiibius sp. GilTou73 TaxID=2904523 RepID=UPI001F3E9C2B|nr:sugar porter family MFS transporter [Allobranchiibius sp. GilTou73]UIJ33775.1 sugar porter family MFS transporter [Allobranchiibius sp. GilTou73]